MRRAILTGLAIWALLVVGCNLTKGSGESPIAWAPSYAEALKLAAKDKKAVMIKFYADWCGPCKEMESTTLSDPKVVEKAKQLVCVKLDIDTAEGGNLFRQMGGEGVPYIVFAKASGDPMFTVVGLTEPSEFLGALDKAISAK